MNLKDINDLTNKILSESTYKKDDFLNRWPYTAPYLEEKHSPDTKKVKNCGCGQNPCKTYGDRAEPVAEAKKGKELCESCKGEGCKDCDNTGYKMMSEGTSHTGLEKVASKLEKASATHKKQAKKIRDHVEDMKEENLAEISQKTATKAYAQRATNEYETDSDSKKSDAARGRIERKFGKKAGQHADRAAHALTFGRKSSTMPKKPTNEETKEENLAEIAPAIAGVIGRMAGGAVAKKGAMMAGKSMMKKKAANMAGNVVQNKVTQKLSDDDDMNEELHPKLKAIDAKNKERARAFAKQAAQEKEKRKADADAYRAHKNEVMAKGGRPVDALDSWMQKKLRGEDYKPVSKLLESGQFTEDELLKIINSM